MGIKDGCSIEEQILTDTHLLMDCEVTVSIGRSNTPVVGCELRPWVRVRDQGSYRPALDYTFKFTWYRQYCTCSTCLMTFMIKFHLAAQTIGDTLPDDELIPGWLKSSASYQMVHGGSLSCEDIVVVKEEGKAWIRIGYSSSYTPSLKDVGLSLKLVCVATNGPLGTSVTPAHVLVTNPVITAPSSVPRSMLTCQNLVTKSTDSFSVVSYNVLADIYARLLSDRRCPSWALTWEYRSQKFLDEILMYDADILCLQEVQNDHFENFFRPQLGRYGYSAIYKERTNAVYTASQYTTDGCATFYREKKFRKVKEYEVDFNKMALHLIRALQLDPRSALRLLKGNIALVVILEEVNSGHAAKARVCVANTHIHSDSELSDTKLFQVASLINGLEEITFLQIPTLICGDLNSAPGSEPHKLLATGNVNSLTDNFRDPAGIYPYLNVRHSMCLASAYSSLLESSEVDEEQKRKMNSVTGEPFFTRFARSPSTVDYIFYTANMLEVVGLLELIDEESFGGRALPSPLWPSDHIALMARFKIDPAFRRPQYASPPPDPWQQAEAKSSGGPAGEDNLDHHLPQL